MREPNHNNTFVCAGDIEILITGRGDKTVKPRSFTPAPETPEHLSSTHAPLSSTTSPGSIKLGNVVVISNNNKEELAFQAPPFKPENYKVTDFSHQTTPQGHSYRLIMLS